MDSAEKLHHFKEMLKKSEHHTIIPDDNPVEKILNHIDNLKNTRLSSNTLHMVEDIYSIQLRNEKHIEKIEDFLSSMK